MDEELKDVVEDTDADTTDDVESEKDDTEIEVEDTDADTADIERTESADFDSIKERISSLESMLEELRGIVVSIKDAQSVLIENGAVVQESDDLDLTDDLDDFRPISELDLTLD